MAWLSTPSLVCQLRNLSFYMIHGEVASVTSATSSKDNQRPELVAHPHLIPIRCSPGEGQRAEPHPHPGTGRSPERETSKYILWITHYYNSAAEGRDVRGELGIQSRLRPKTAAPPLPVAQLPSLWVLPHPPEGPWPGPAWAACCGCS